MNDINKHTVIVNAQYPRILVQINKDLIREVLVICKNFFRVLQAINLIDLHSHEKWTYNLGRWKRPLGPMDPYDLYIYDHILSNFL